MENEIVIVAYECMTSLGSSLYESWENLTGNKSGIKKITRYNSEGQSLKGVSAIEYAGEIPLCFDEIFISKNNQEKFPEPSYHLVKMVCKKLLKSIDFNVSKHNEQRIAIIGGTALTSQISQSHVEQENKPFVNFILNQCSNIPLSAVAKEFGIKGPSFCVGGACASSNHAIFLGQQLIKAGLLDSAIIVGFEFPITPICVGGFSWLKSLYTNDRFDDRAYIDSSKASRPFSKDRRGFTLAEGVGAILISNYDYAKKNNWPMKTKISGGYMNSDGDEMVRMNIESISLCMKMAIINSHKNIEQIDCINAHATSTKVGDSSEMLALSNVFNHRLSKIPIVGNKSQIGHSLGASSIIELIIASESITNKLLTPTLNLIRDDEMPKAFFPSETIDYEHKTVLLNSFGFGGTNASIIIESIN